MPCPCHALTVPFFSRHGNGILCESALSFPLKACKQLKQTIKNPHFLKRLNMCFGIMRLKLDNKESNYFFYFQYTCVLNVTDNTWKNKSSETFSDIYSLVLTSIILSVSVFPLEAIRFIELREHRKINFFYTAITREALTLSE